MMQLKDELAKLNDEFESLRLLQKKSQKSIDDELQYFAVKLEGISVLINAQSQVPQLVNEEEADFSSFQEQPELILPKPALDNVALSESCEQQRLQTVKLALSPETVHRSEYQKKPIVQNDKPHLKEQATDPLGGFLVSFFGALFSPLVMLFEQVSTFYLHYQKRGLGPVFLMTVAGLVTLTAGFAYILQYSVTHWLSEFSKIMLAFVFANSIIAGALFMNKKRPEMQDFSSSLMGLGLILNYLSAYFMGPYFQLVSALISFFLLLFITVCGFYIAMKLEAKVVSLCALIGGSLAPVMVLSEGHVSLLYLPYLLIIGGCALMQSRLLKWPTLMQVTVVLHISCIELFLLYLGSTFIDLGGQELIALLSVNGLFYFYGAMLLTDQSNRNKVSKWTVTLLFSLLAFVLLVMAQLTLFSGEIFIANGMICGVLFLFFKNDKQLQSLLLVFAGSFAGFAALQLVSPDLLGLVLLLEAVLLLWLGVKESYIAVRFEAYLLLSIGLLTHLQGLAGNIREANYQLVHFSQDWTSLIYLSLIALVLYCSKVLLAKLAFDKKSLLIEATILMVIKELLSLSYAASLLFVAYLINDAYYLNFIPLVSLFLLFIACQEKLKATEIIAWLLLLPLLIMVVFAIVNTGSASFSVQPLYAKLARVELFFCLLFAYYWYQRYFQDSNIVKLAYYLQLACFVILPLFFLPKILRYYTEFSALAFIASSLLCLLLARFVKHRVLILEAKIMTLLTLLAIAVSCLEMLWQGLFALILGATLMASLYFRYPLMGALSRLMMKWQWQWVPYYFSLLIAVICYSLFSSWELVFAVLSVYFVYLADRFPVPDVLRGSYGLNYGLIFICVLTPLLLHLKSLLLFQSQVGLLIQLSEVIILVALGRLIIRRGSVVRHYQKALPLNLLHGIWHTLLLVSYLLWSYQLDGWVAAPLSAILMVIHASALMFISLRPKLSVMVKLATFLFVMATLKILLLDMQHFEIIQKVIAFMFIGAILLGVSYSYQRVLNRDVGDNRGTKIGG